MKEWPSGNSVPTNSPQIGGTLANGVVNQWGSGLRGSVKNLSFKLPCSAQKGIGDADPIRAQEPGKELLPPEMCVCV